MGWLIALAAVVLLAMVPLGVSARYDAGGPLVYILAGPVRIKVYPAPKKKKDKPAGQEKPKQQAAPSAESKGKSGGSVKDFVPLIKVALDFLGDLRRKLRVNRLELNVILAGDDPCDLATNYGKAWAVLGNLWPQLERLFVIKKRDVEVQCDFEASETLVTARLDLTITLGRSLALAVRYGIRALKELITLKNKKGGATT